MIFNSQQGIVFTQTHPNAGYDGASQGYPFMPMYYTPPVTDQTYVNVALVRNIATSKVLTLTKK